MNILIIGGGVFVGSELLREALRHGHHVTVFNRGRSRTVWPAGVEAISGDRQADLARLAGRRWDAVIDTCGYTPAEVERSATALRDACDVYCFVSSVSAYADTTEPMTAEDHPLASAEGIARDDRDMRHYGPQKAACEAEVMKVFGQARALVVRPGLIVGPGDRSGRFSYWVWRAAAGGRMLVPDVPADSTLQFIDVRDLARWMVHAIERGERGAFNASGPVEGGDHGEAATSAVRTGSDAREDADVGADAGAHAGSHAGALSSRSVNWPRLIAACRAAAAAADRGLQAAEPVEIDEAFLLQHGVQPWSELPLWLPSIDPAYTGFNRNLTRAAAAGLRTRPLADTIAAVLEEGIPDHDDKRRAAKLTREREADLLAAWSAAAAVSPPADQG